MARAKLLVAGSVWMLLGQDGHATYQLKDAVYTSEVCRTHHGDNPSKRKEEGGGYLVKEG